MRFFIVQRIVMLGWKGNAVNHAIAIKKSVRNSSAIGPQSQQTTGWEIHWHLSFDAVFGEWNGIGTFGTGDKESIKGIIVVILKQVRFGPRLDITYFCRRQRAFLGGRCIGFLC